MSDLFDDVTEDQDPFKRLLSKIPGFGGYIERQNRRAADKILRELIGERFRAIWKRVGEVQQDLVSQGEILQLDDIEKATLNKKYDKAAKFFTKTANTLYKGKGCETCHHTGYRGRTAIFEIIEVDYDMQEVFMKNPSSNQIWEIAKNKGSMSLFEDGIEKVKKGVTTIEELLRVAAPRK